MNPAIWAALIGGGSSLLGSLFGRSRQGQPINYIKPANEQDKAYWKNKYPDLLHFKGKGFDTSRFYEMQDRGYGEERYNIERQDKLQDVGRVADIQNQKQLAYNPQHFEQRNEAELNRMNMLFPGTTPWERLGTSPGGGMGPTSAGPLPSQQEAAGRAQQQAASAGARASENAAKIGASAGHYQSDKNFAAQSMATIANTMMQKQGIQTNFAAKKIEGGVKLLTTGAKSSRSMAKMLIKEGQGISGWPDTIIPGGVGEHYNNAPGMIQALETAKEMKAGAFGTFKNTGQLKSPGKTAGAGGKQMLKNPGAIGLNDGALQDMLKMLMKYRGIRQ